MDNSVFHSTQIIQAILAPAVTLSSSALFFLGLSARYVALITRIRLLSDEKRQILSKLNGNAQAEISQQNRLLSINQQLNVLLRSTWFVRNAILCQILAVILFVFTSSAIGVSFLVSAPIFQQLPLYLFSGGLFLILCGVTCMAIDIIVSYPVILIEVNDPKLRRQLRSAYWVSQIPSSVESEEQN